MEPVNRNTEALKDIFVKSGLGAGLTVQELKLIVGQAVQLQFKKGARILEEKTKSRDLFIIHSGEVSVRLTLPTLHFMEESTARMKEGEIFGEFSFINGEPRSATIQAESQVSLIRFDYDALMKLFEDDPRLGYIMMRNLAAIVTGRIKEIHKKMRKLLLNF